MALPKWLDRLWLTLIAISFLIMVPLFTLLWAQRLGWRNLLVVVLVLFGLGFYRGLR